MIYINAAQELVLFDCLDLRFLLCEFNGKLFYLYFTINSY